MSFFLFPFSARRCASDRDFSLTGDGLKFVPGGLRTFLERFSMQETGAALPQVIDDCHELLKWLISLPDKLFIPDTCACPKNKSVRKATARSL